MPARNALLRQFGGLERLSQASEAELAQVKGVSARDVERIAQFFRSAPVEREESAEAPPASDS